MRVGQRQHGLEKSNLTLFSSPEKWVEAFLPDKRKPTDPKYILTIAEWCTLSNTKAILANAGEKVESTQNLKHFPQLK
jgi:hypothetical protein